MYSNLLNKLQKVLVSRKLLIVYSGNSCARSKMCFHNWCFLKCELKLTQIFVVNKVMPFSFEQLGSTTGKYSTFNREGELNAVLAENSVLQQEEDLQKNPSISQFSELAVDLDTEKKILLILMEYEMSKQCGIRVPSMLTLDDMKELLTIETRGRRSGFMVHLFLKEARKKNELHKKEERRKAREIALKIRENSPQPEGLIYGLGKNSFFFYIRDATITRFYNHREANALLYGSKIVVDLDYDQFMVKAECQNCSYQLAELYGANKRNKDPFELYFCNANPSNLTIQMVRKQIPNMNEPHCFINLTESSYLDIFPKDKLVYLSPHAKEVLKCYDPDTIYIIGGIVDKTCHDQVSIAKVKREGLKTARLPLDEYLLWGLGSKSLPLNLIMEIMLEIKNTGEWEKALRFVPRRKLKRLDSLSEETSWLGEKNKKKPYKRLATEFFINEETKE